MWINRNVVMLPTNEKANILKGSNAGNNLLLDNGDNINHSLVDGKRFQYQHLFITSGEEIKEGDWFYSKIVQKIFKATNEKYNLQELNLNICNHKIIVTTDTSLSYKFREKEVQFPQTIFLPRPSQQFIQQYIEEYNKGNVITKIEVEYEDLTEQLQESVDNLRDNCLEDFDNEEESPYYHLLEQAIIELGNYIPKLKVNPDNTINIKPIKDSWSREEVIKLIEKFNDNIEYVYNYGEEALNEWIEENL